MTKENISPWQIFVSGSAAACVELAVGHPLWTIKTRLQGGKPFTLNPRILYNGFWPNAYSMMPITSTQVFLNQVFENLYSTYANGEASQVTKLASAFSGGAAGAVLACPVEMVMTHMKVGQNFIETSRILMNQAGLKRLYTGLLMTAKRDGCFGIGFMALPEVLEPYFKPYFEGTYATWAAKITAGVTSAVLSQGFDTVKATQQSAVNPISFFDAVKEPYAKHGFFGYLKGGLPRMGRVASAVCVMSTVTEQVNTFFSKSEVEEPPQEGTSASARRKFG